MSVLSVRATYRAIFLTVIPLGLFTLISCSGGGPIKPLLDRFDRALEEVSKLRNTIKDEGNAWRVQLDEMQFKFTEDAKTILNQDLRQFTDKSIGAFGQELRCDVDFLEKKITGYLDRLEADLKKARADALSKKVDPASEAAQEIINRTIKNAGHISPHVCQTIPAEIRFDHANKYGEAHAFTAQQANVTLKGFNLNNPDRPEAQGEYSLWVIRPVAGKDSEEIPANPADAHLSFANPYEVLISLRALEPIVKRGDQKLRLKHNGVSLTEISFDFGSEPPPPERVTSVTGNIHTTDQDREGGFCILRLKDGGNTIWEHKYPEFPTWTDNNNAAISAQFDAQMPANPQLEVILTQEGARERNILWRFQIQATFVTSRGRQIVFEKGQTELRTDGGRRTQSVGIPGSVR